METITWLGIFVCISQSATMSGLNISLFSLSRLRLEVAAEHGDKYAERVLRLRKDANFTLATILWGNVSINVLLTLLVDSVLIGVASFLFSTVVITIVGEIITQAYFTRHALRIGSALSPVLRFYKILLFPVSKPTGMLLDKLVGEEPIPWFREDELRNVLKHHAMEGDTEVGAVEAAGAVNFLDLDDLSIKEEGEIIDNETILGLDFENGKPVFPGFKSSSRDGFLKKIAAPGKKWFIIKDKATDLPRMVLNVPKFLRGALFNKEGFNPLDFCHFPLLETDADCLMGNILGKLTVEKTKPGDDVIDKDIILLWADTEKRIITGSDILGRLLRKIVRSN